MSARSWVLRKPDSGGWVDPKSDADFDSFANVVNGGVRMGAYPAVVRALRGEGAASPGPAPLPTRVAAGLLTGFALS